MDSFKNYKSNLKKWDKTLEAYVNWVSRSDLRKYFSEEITINNFSLWWVTNICAKNNLEENKWYYDLKDCLTKNKKIKFNKLNFYLIFSFKLLKNLTSHFIWFFTIKFLSFSRYKKIKRKNCFHSFNYNFLKNGDFLYDRLYGKATFLKNRNDNFHIVDIINKKHFFKNYFKKKHIPCVIADEFITIFDFASVYYKTIAHFFRVNNHLNKKKKFFFINGVDCRKILEPFLLISFAGQIQKSLLRAISIKNFLKKNKVKFFINYGEFTPGYRSIYFFVKNLKKPPSIVSIQHSIANRSILYCVHKKNEFTKNKDLEGKYFSPTPDYYLTQGKQYDKILKTFFPNKTKIIGSLRYDLFKFKNKTKKKIFKIKFNKKKKDEKIILVCPSIADELDVLNYTKDSYNSKYRYILSPHPVIKELTISRFLNAFEKKSELEIYDDVSTFDLLSISDIAICGCSAIAHEALFNDVQSIRVVNSENPPFIDLNDKDGVINAESPKELKKILNRKINFKRNKNKINKLKKFFFHKLDNKAYLRFWNFMKEQNL